ncbi:hypothetical protein KC331_g13211 [Hortaea werneckii]|nr:hypothetical protein KC331_g13211 [Hortaea werneckii]
MHPKASTVAIAALTLFATLAFGRNCHVESSVSHTQNSACGSGSCIVGSTDTGASTLYINGKSVHSAGNYQKLSNGNGVDVDFSGVKYHVAPLGIPLVTEHAKCALKFPDGYVNLGKPDTGSEGLPGVQREKLKCVHGFVC